MRLRGLLTRVSRRSPGDHTVWLRDSVNDELERESERYRPRESGGLLLGYRVEEETVVIGVIAAGPRAQRAAFSFRPDGPWQRHSLETAFDGSRGTVTYVGDWHSHPTGSGVPSCRDTKTARLIAEHRDAQLPEPIIIINVRNGSTWNPSAYVYRRGKLRPCTVRSFGP